MFLSLSFKWIEETAADEPTYVQGAIVGAS
jgi:hypothetical protein